MKWTSRVGFGMIAGLFVLAGCVQKPVAPYRSFVDAGTAPLTTGETLYDDLGAQALQAVPEPQLATYTPGYKESARKKMSLLLEKLALASQHPVVLQPAPRKPTDDTIKEAGWAKMGTVLSWLVQDAVYHEDYKDAVRWFGVAERFGFDLTSGDVVQAQTGLGIVDQSREAIAPAVSKMTPQLLADLEKQTVAGLDRVSPPSKTLENEKQDMLEAVQVLQDAYRNRATGGLKPLADRAYHDASEAFSYLENMSEDTRPGYFDGMASEAESTVALAERLSKEPECARNPEVLVWQKELSMSKDRPWRKLAPHYFGTWQPYLDQYDLTLARTRLLGLTALAEIQVKAQGTAPADLLSAAPEELKTDPFTLKPFGYSAAAGDFKVYSFGADGRDDEGDSDETGTQPDIVLFGTANSSE